MSLVPPLHTLQVFAERRFQYNDIALFIGLRGPHDLHLERIAAPVEFRDYAPDVQQPGPTLALSYAEAQMLVDQLWLVGVRPSEGAGSAGAMAATERHLKDMQRIAFGALREKGLLEPPPKGSGV